MLEFVSVLRSPHKNLCNYEHNQAPLIAKSHYFRSREDSQSKGFVLRLPRHVFLRLLILNKGKTVTYYFLKITWQLQQLASNFFFLLHSYFLVYIHHHFFPPNPHIFGIAAVLLIKFFYLRNS